MTELDTALWFVIRSMVYGGICGFFFSFIPFLKLARPRLILFWVLNILFFGVWFFSQFSDKNWLVHNNYLKWPIALWLNASMAYAACASVICGIRLLYFVFKKQPKRLFLRNPNTLLIPFVWLLSAFGVYEAMTPPLLKTYDVYLHDLPVELDGFKVAQITDSHIADFVSSSELAENVQRLNTLKPDLLVMTGDLINDERQVDEAFQALEQTNAPLGVIGILGNHEKYHGLALIEEKYKTESQKFPIRLLVDNHVSINYRGVTFQVTGVDYPIPPNTRGQKIEYELFEQKVAESAQKAFDGIDPNQWNLFLAHHPNTFNYITEKNASLTLAGHTHGGQVLPLGYLVGQLRYHFDYLKGWYERNQQALFVSVGMGNIWPYRLGVPREIVVFTLHHKK